MIRALLQLSRVSNLPTVWTNVLAAWILSSGLEGWHWRAELGWLLLGASLVYSAGMILNDACDAAWDREHRPERPIPSGQIALSVVWSIGLAWLFGGYAIMVFAGGADWLFTALLLAAIVAYDVYHKPWTGSVIVMGACRTLLYLSAMSAAHGRLVLGPMIWIGVYVVALTLIARAESKGKVGTPGRLLATVALLLPAIMQWFGQHTGCKMGEGVPPYAWLPVLISVAWTAWALWLMRQGGKAIGEAVGLLLAGIVIVDGVAIAELNPLVAIGFCALAPLLRLWQRWVAAT